MQRESENLYLTARCHREVRRRVHRVVRRVRVLGAIGAARHRIRSASSRACSVGRDTGLWIARITATDRSNYRLGPVKASGQKSTSVQTSSVHTGILA